jgi:hypothetical protein
LQPAVGYCFKPQRDFVKKADYPRLPAVYRLFKDGELVRIGETGNLEDRLKDHFQEYGDKVDFYDFAEIHDASARKQEERRLLSEFKDAHGSLPKYNPVTA